MYIISKYHFLRFSEKKSPHLKIKHINYPHFFLFILLFYLLHLNSFVLVLQTPSVASLDNLKHKIIKTTILLLFIIMYLFSPPMYYTIKPTPQLKKIKHNNTTFLKCIRRHETLIRFSVAYLCFSNKYFILSSD